MARLTVDLVVLTLRHGELCVLLEQRTQEPWRGAWALPGREVADDQSLEDAAYVELERVGFTVSELVLEQLRTYGDVDRDPRGRSVSVAWMVLGADLEVPDSDELLVDWWPVALAGRENLTFDHGTILADGVERARAKLEYSALATAFCRREFTIPQLREVYEAVWGERLDARNFHRKVMSVKGFVVDTGRRTHGRGRPATLYRHGRARVLHPPILRRR
ncbi:NUDIX hydrolase [Mariniluteicoccus endophyticus]